MKTADDHLHAPPPLASDEPDVVDPPQDGVAAVDRALSVVLAVMAHKGPVTLADIARGSALYKSTVLRLLASLERGALVVRRDDGRYELGPLAYRLGRAYDGTRHLTRIIQPVLDGLVNQGSESASFHVYHDLRTRLCLLRVDSSHATLDRIRTGDLLPLDRGAAGKLILRLRSTPTVTPQDLVAVSLGERDPLCAAVASPVFGPDQEFMGVISLSGPAERFTPDAISRMSMMAMRSAAAATVALGGVWPEQAGGKPLDAATPGH